MSKTTVITIANQKSGTGKTTPPTISLTSYLRIKLKLSLVKAQKSLHLIIRLLAFK
ncbi:ParA family protein [Paenibacillus kribbensis]|uniref:ParA family protein n=1 Tax=Paenibacillus kribbensis TaxID=172713 RepID=UPI00114C8E03|nr:ParA family protein [Paenibacillus kribbensis]